MNTIKVLLVDDSTFMRKAIRYMLDSDKEIEIIDEAGEGREALEKTLSLKPDVVIMDIIMPVMDGLWALDEIMKQRPTPVLMLSSIGVKDSEIAKEAFALGVVDVLLKPDNPQNLAIIQKELTEKIKAASRVNKLRLLEYKSIVVKERVVSKILAHQAIVIATSAGGPTSLYEVISRFSDNFYGSVIVAQHMPVHFISSFVNHVQMMTSLSVSIGKKGDLLYSRRVIFSPTNCTLEVYKTKKGFVTDLTDYKMRLQPDINRVIISCAEAFKSSMVLIVLSGLGNDGVKGAEIVKKYGGKVIVEDESTAGVYLGMPANVIKSGFYDVTCPSYNITEAAEQLLSKKVYTARKKNFMVKGIVLRSIIEYIKTNFSEEILNHLISALSENTKNIITSIRQYNYYSSDIYIELIKVIYEQISLSKSTIIEDISFDSAKESIKLYETVLLSNNMDDFGNFIQMFARIIFPGLTGENIQVNQDKKIASCVFRTDGYEKENLKLYCLIKKGWIMYFAKLMKLNSSNVICDSGEDDKGYYIKCNLIWH